MKQYSKEKYEELGMLIGVPENRKDRVVNAINIIINQLGEVEEYAVTLGAPIAAIMRIVIDVDVSDKDILLLYDEILAQFKSHDFEQDRADCDYYGMDYEAMFLVKLAEFKIKEIKEKIIV